MLAANDALDHDCDFYVSELYQSKQVLLWAWKIYPQVYMAYIYKYIWFGGIKSPKHNIFLLKYILPLHFIP